MNADGARGIRVHLVGPIKEIAGSPVVVFEADEPVTVGRLLIALETRLGPRFGREVSSPAYPGGPPFYQVLVNGVNIMSGSGLETPLRAGDEVLISPPIAGG